jgi:cobalamin transport system substrate-binding protein
MLLAAVLAACTGTPSATTGGASPAPAMSPAPAPATATVPATPVTTPSPSATFPLTVTDDEGTTVTIKAEPQKVVTMTPAATDTLFALGLGSRVVGKSEDATPYSPDAAKVPDLVTYRGADVERIAALAPDVVIAGGHNLNRPDDILKLRSLGIPVLVVYAPDLEGILADVALIGRVVGRPEQAAGIASDIQSAFDEVKAATAPLGVPRVYAELDATGGYWLPAPDDLLTDMIRAAGGDPLTSGTPGLYQIDSEKIVAFDPQVILLSDTYSVKVGDVASRPGWSVLSAVRTGDVRPIDATTATRPGPRLADGIRAVALAIHPNVVLPGASASPAATSSTTP